MIQSSTTRCSFGMALDKRLTLSRLQTEIRSRSVRVTSSLQSDALDLVKSDFVARPVVQLRRSRRFMGSNRLGVFNVAAIVQIGRDSGCAKRMATNVAWEAGCFCTALDHSKYVVARHRIDRQLARPPKCGAK